MNRINLNTRSLTSSSFCSSSAPTPSTGKGPVVFQLGFTMENDSIREARATVARTTHLGNLIQPPGSRNRSANSNLENQSENVESPIEACRYPLFKNPYQVLISSRRTPPRTTALCTCKCISAPAFCSSHNTTVKHEDTTIE